MKALFRYDGPGESMSLNRDGDGMSIWAGVQYENGECLLPDAQAERLAIALIQATPGDDTNRQRIEVDGQMVTPLDAIGTGEELVAFGLALIRAAVRK